MKKFCPSLVDISCIFQNQISSSSTLEQNGKISDECIPEILRISCTRSNLQEINTGLTFSKYIENIQKLFSRK